MKPNQQARDLSSNGTGQSASFGISANDTAFIMSILRSQLYTDKILAVLREYGANAWDANRDAGKMNRPIKVTLPTSMEPTLSIRDYGKGLSMEDVFTVYTQYGASTKRSSDTAVGMLGIGSKSGFAYSDSFNIISFHGGMKRYFVAVLDSSEKGIINLLLEEKTEEETGVLIQIPVRPEDLEEFHDKAKELFSFFKPRPEINIALPEPLSEGNTFTHGEIRKGEAYGFGGWVAVMGCIPYKVDLSQIRGEGAGDGIPDFLTRLEGSLYFNIGDVQVSASREELEYGPTTRKALVKKFEELIDEFVQKTIADIESESQSSWDKRIKSQRLRWMGIPVPDLYKEFMLENVKVPPKLKSLDLLSWEGKTQVSSIEVDGSTRLIFKNDERPLSGFGLRHYDILIRPHRKLSQKKLLTVTCAMLNQMKIEGVEVCQLSDMEWTKPPKKIPSKAPDERHRKRSFVFNGMSYHSARSRNWNVIKREPTKEDVFVILDAFETTRYGFDFYARVTADIDIAKRFGRKMPEVYGYKNTSARPVHPAACTGTHYPIWHQQFISELYNDPEVRGEIEVWRSMQEEFLNADWRSWKNHTDDNLELLTLLRKELGASHLMTELFDVAVSMYQSGASKYPEGGCKRLYDALHSCNFPPIELDAIRDEALKKYPLLKETEEGIGKIWEESVVKHRWIDYIKLVDQVAVQTPPPVAGATEP